MSRTLNSAALSALSQKEVQIYFAISLQFPQDYLRLWTGVGETILNGFVYTGGGSMIGLSQIDEGLEVSAKGAQVSLSGIPRSASEPLALALSTDYRGGIGKIYVCILDADSTTDLNNLSNDYGNRFDELFTGYMDVMTIDEGEDTATITLSLESRLIALRRSINRRFTPNWLKSKYPTDEGLDFTNNTPLQKLRWGR